MKINSFILLLLIWLVGCIPKPFLIDITRTPPVVVAEYRPIQTLAAPTPFPSPHLVQSIELTEIANGLQKPVYLTHAFDQRLFVVEQAGKIKIIDHGELLATPFLDIVDRVGSKSNEQGLLSVAFHPNYPQNGIFFIQYTNLDGDSVVERYHVASDDPNSADLTSATPLFTLGQPYSNHNGGQLQFGKDGYLYIGLGDGGSGGDPQGHAQNQSDLLGDILRIDVDHGDPYAIPSDNPFVGEDAKRGEIWASGFRNPWRFSFDRLTGDLYIADVGQNEREELNFQSAESKGGENYGWNYWEGTHCYEEPCSEEKMVMPVLEYDHDQGCSITGGYLYRGTKWPSLWGNYLYADYCQGKVWAVIRPNDLNAAWTPQLLLDGGIQPASFGEDWQGELYIVDHGGIIYQIINAE